MTTKSQMKELTNKQLRKLRRNANKELLSRGVKTIENFKTKLRVA